MTKVTIGIQARSGSSRLPNKISEVIGRRTVLQHVMEACFKASIYLNNWSSKKILVEVAVLVPYGDPIKNRIDKEILVIEGPETDVLARYRQLLNQRPSDYIARITADCPLIPHFVISKLITLAVMNEYDYVSNVDERVRTTPDGYDCEILSQKALVYADVNATKADDREHVTTLLRSNPPPWLNQGCTLNFLDLSWLKLSVDTLSDLKRVQAEYEGVEEKYDLAVKLFGKKSVHRY